MIRFGENALFRLASAPVIVRIARTADYLPLARNEVAVSRWLAGEGFPAARVIGDLEQPLLIHGHPVTFWHLVVEGDRKATYGELGAVLRDLHTLDLPAGLDIPTYSVFGKTDLRLDRAAGIPDDDIEFLRKRDRELRDEYAGLRFESATGPVHGDAHVQNLMVDDRGRVLLIDFEAFSFDHPEWDLMRWPLRTRSVARLPVHPRRHRSARRTIPVPRLLRLPGTCPLARPCRTAVEGIHRQPL